MSKKEQMYRLDKSVKNETEVLELIVSNGHVQKKIDVRDTITMNFFFNDEELLNISDWKSIHGIMAKSQQLIIMELVRVLQNFKTLKTKNKIKEIIIKNKKEEIIDISKLNTLSIIFHEDVVETIFNKDGMTEKQVYMAMCNTTRYLLKIVPPEAINIINIKNEEGKRHGNESH